MMDQPAPTPNPSPDQTPAPSPAQLDALANLLAHTSEAEIDCVTVLDRVAAYLEAYQTGAELSDELRAVAQHFNVCPECREEFDALVAALRDELA